MLIENIKNNGGVHKKKCVSWFTPLTHVAHFPMLLSSVCLLCYDYLPSYWFLSCLHFHPVTSDLSNCVTCGNLFCVHSMISLFIYTILFLCFVAKSHHSLVSLGPFSKFPCCAFAGFTSPFALVFENGFFWFSAPHLVFDLGFGLQLWLLDLS